MTLGENSDPKSTPTRWQADWARWAHHVARKAAAEQARLAALRDAGHLREAGVFLRTLLQSRPPVKTADPAPSQPPGETPPPF